MIRITSDVECGNGKEIEQLAVDRFRLQVDGDKQSGYCGYFCFDIINDGPASGRDRRTVGRRQVRRPYRFSRPISHHRLVQAGRFPPLSPPAERAAFVREGPCSLHRAGGADQHVRVAMTYVAPLQ